MAREQGRVQPRALERKEVLHGVTPHAPLAAVAGHHGSPAQHVREALRKDLRVVASLCRLLAPKDLLDAGRVRHHD
jgi:hypothetical protein